MPRAKSREVLRLLLERRGAKTLEAARPEDAIRLARDLHPDLIVFDAESDKKRKWQNKPTDDLRDCRRKSHPDRYSRQSTATP